ncbi:MAG: hypothetical protein AAFY56_21800, partial [Pseudomonadota bacterium]
RIDQEHKSLSAAEKADKKKLVIGSLLAAGAMHLSSWHVQAHGNRSSHKTDTCASSWVPRGASLFEVVAAREQWFTVSHSIQKQLNEFEAAGQTDSASYKALVESAGRLADLGQAQGGMLAQTVALARAGNTAAAVCLIEGQVDPADVFRTYQAVIMSLAGDRGGEIAMNEGLVETIWPIAKAAASFADLEVNRLDNSGANVGIQLDAAALYFNIASFTITDSGHNNQDRLELARHAADRSYEIRKLFNLDRLVMESAWKRGYVAYLQGDEADAREMFEESAQLADTAGDQLGVAWAEIYLAKLMADLQPEYAQELRERAMRVVEQKNSAGDNPSGYHLDYLKAILEDQL